VLKVGVRSVSSVSSVVLGNEVEAGVIVAGNGVGDGVVGEDEVGGRVVG